MTRFSEFAFLISQMLVGVPGPLGHSVIRLVRMGDKKGQELATIIHFLFSSAALGLAVKQKGAIEG